MDLNILSKCALLFTFLVVHAENTVWLTDEPWTPPTLACGGVDLVFLVDTSRSIWGLDFERQLDFLDKVVSKFDIGPAAHQTRVGVIAYAQTFWVRFYLRSHLTLPSLRKAIKRIPHKYGSKTRTEKALKFLRTHMYRPFYGGRKNSTHVAILISDGRSQDRKATRKEAQKAKEEGIKLFTIGVGQRAEIEELKEIASDPDEYFVFKVGNFEALDSLNYKLPTSTCDVDDVNENAGAITTKTSTLPTAPMTSKTTTEIPRLTLDVENSLEHLSHRKTTLKPPKKFSQRINEIIKSNNVLQGIPDPTTKSPRLYTAQNGLIGLTNEAITIIKDEILDEFENSIDDSFVPSGQNTVGSNVQSTVAPNGQNIVGSNVQNTVGSNVQNTVGSNVQNTVGLNVQYTISSNVQNTVAPNVQNTVAPNGQNTVVPNGQNTPGLHEQNTPGPNIENNVYDQTTQQTQSAWINQNNIRVTNESERTIILPIAGSKNGLATWPERFFHYTTRPNTIHNEELAQWSNSLVEEGVRPTPVLSPEQTTTISNEILQGLAAYSIKPITEDQAQKMSNYILRDVPAETYCHHKHADIYFVLDASNSIWPEDFKQQLSFVNSVIDILDVTRGNTRVGVIVYSTQIHPIVMIDSGLTKTQIKRQVNAIHYVSGRTNTSDALRFIRKYGFAPRLIRKDAVKLGIILTDGISRNPIATKAESNKCRKENINLFAVGIGKHVDQTELKRIANDPDHKFMFHVASYGALNSIKDFLAITACSVVPDQPNRLTICSSPGPMDLVFSYDSFALGARKSQMINFFIHDLLNSLDFNNGNLQVGRLTDNCPEQTNIPISSNKNLTAFSRIPYPGVASLIQKMNSSFSNRDDAKKLGVVFIDDSTEGIEKAIQVIKGGLDFKLMVIGIGDRKTTDLAGDLCSYPKHDYFLQVPEYSTLLRARSKLLDKLCTSMMATG